MVYEDRRREIIVHVAKAANRYGNKVRQLEQKEISYDLADPDGGLCAFSSFPNTATALLTRV
jgi:hypothetical protein